MENKLPKRDEFGRFLPRKNNETVLVLRTCNKDMSSRNNFVWPRSGPVSCYDWKPTKECGHGLHGFLKGEGNPSLADWGDKATWLVVEVFVRDIIDLDGKVKFPRGNVLYAGDRKTATDMILARHSKAKVMGASVVVGDKQKIALGYNAVVVAGCNSQVTVGSQSKITVDENSSVKIGDECIVNASSGCDVAAGHSSNVIVGQLSNVETGPWSKIVAGRDSVVAAGDASVICIEHFSHITHRNGYAVSYVGENGIEPHVPYRVNNKGKLVRSPLKVKTKQ